MGIGVPAGAVRAALAPTNRGSSGSPPGYAGAGPGRLHFESHRVPEGTARTGRTLPRSRCASAIRRSRPPSPVPAHQPECFGPDLSPGCPTSVRPPQLHERRALRPRSGAGRTVESDQHPRPGVVPPGDADPGRPRRSKGGALADRAGGRTAPTPRPVVHRRGTGVAPGRSRRGGRAARGEAQRAWRNLLLHGSASPSILTSAPNSRRTGGAYGRGAPGKWRPWPRG
jgi:hypothetical protein